MGNKVSLLNVQIKIADLTARLVRYQKDAREWPSRHLDRLEEEREALEGIFEFVREADEALASAIAFADGLEAG